MCMQAFQPLRVTTVSDLQGVVAVVNQEVLLEPQLPLPSATMDQANTRLDLLICLVHVVQKGRGAVEGHLYLRQDRNRSNGYCEEQT